MKKIGIIGFGILGKQLLHFLEEQEKNISDIYIFDDFEVNSEIYNILPFSKYHEKQFLDLDFYIGLGYHHLKLRNTIINNLLKNKKKVKSFIHRTSYISPSAIIKEGCIIFPFVNIDQNVKISTGNILHNNVVISHDSVLQEGSYFSPNVTICGNSKIGRCCFLGAGSIISNSITVNDFVQIALGTVVSKNLEKNISVIGNPMKKLSKMLEIK